MKTISKAVMIILFLICLPICSFSNIGNQQYKASTENVTTVNDSLKLEIIKLQESIKENAYTRIPNKDFENIIDGKIEKSIREIVKWVVFIIGVFFSVLGFFGFKYSNKYLDNAIDNKLKELKSGNEETIKSISNKYFSTIGDSLIDFKIEAISKKNHVAEAREIDDFKNSLNNDSITISDYKKALVIDTIMRCYYYSSDPDKTKKMIALIKEYEQKYTLSHTTYINAAIAFSDMYEKFGSKDYFDSAIENCNKSINILPDYGLAFSQKLELLIMATAKAFDDTEMKHYQNQLLKVFKDIENSKSSILCFELTERFEVDKKSFLKPYIEKLYNEYPDEMAKITARSNAYIANTN
jgi:hypothetical protein